ncbi:MAG: helicase-related protein [Terrimicrobiaceae bacterium]
MPSGASVKNRRSSTGTRRARAQPLQEPPGWREVAFSRFGIREPHFEQALAIESVLAGRDTLAVLPTGFGKSLIYQVPALLLPRPTLVISPLIALMADQERALRRRRVPVVRIDSSLKAAERRASLARLTADSTLVVLTTSEMVQSENVAPMFERVVPALVAELGLEDPRIIVAPPHRTNLEVSALLVSADDKVRAAGRLIKRLRRPGIVYCATTAAVDHLWRALISVKIPAVKYHGRMSARDRAFAQREFMRSRRRMVMIATSAFGMGIDKPNIRYIIHYHAPASLEQYVQEAGRAGRDGKPARAPVRRHARGMAQLAPSLSSFCP